MSSLSVEQLTTLRTNIISCFNDSELRTLCFDLGIDYDSLSGSNKADKGRELVSYCQRLDNIKDLIAECVKRRPNNFDFVVLNDTTDSSRNENLTSDEELALYRKGRKLIDARRYSEAVTCWTKLKEQKPNDSEIDAYLRLCLSKVERNIKAEESLHELISIKRSQLMSLSLMRPTNEEDAERLRISIMEIQADMSELERQLRNLHRDM